jgi:hypothetical protein
LPELFLEKFVFAAPDEAVRAAERLTRRRAPIPAPTEFVSNSKVYFDKIAVTFLLRGHRGDHKEGGNT